jgi:hypothetical protein
MGGGGGVSDGDNYKDDCIDFVVGMKFCFGMPLCYC